MAVVGSSGTLTYSVCRVLSRGVPQVTCYSVRRLQTQVDHYSHWRGNRCPLLDSRPAFPPLPSSSFLLPPPLDQVRGRITKAGGVRFTTLPRHSGPNTLPAEEKGLPTRRQLTHVGEIFASFLQFTRNYFSSSSLSLSINNVHFKEVRDILFSLAQR